VSVSTAGQLPHEQLVSPLSPTQNVQVSGYADNPSRPDFYRTSTLALVTSRN